MIEDQATAVSAESHFASNKAINIVVAHKLEAKALVSMLKLKREHSGGEYPLFSNADGITLIVAGIGRTAVSAACEFLGRQQQKDDGCIKAWLNLGIAGHGTASLGSTWLANKITEQCSGRSAYPPLLVEGVGSCSVITVDTPENDYSIDAVYEMEASAFFEAASKFSTAELVQVIKIISDNKSNPISDIDLANVPIWIAAQKTSILSVLSQLGSLLAEYNNYNRLPRYYSEICSKYHFTVSQKIQLKNLCLRYRAMRREAELVVPNTHVTSRQIVQRLIAGLKNVRLN